MQNTPSPVRNEAVPVLYFSGRSPFDLSSGGGTVYVRAHARVARALGYDVHLTYAAPEPLSGGFDIGRVHGVRHGIADRHYWMPVCYRAVVRMAVAVAEPLARLGRPVILHAFGPWACAAAATRDALRERGLPAAVIASSFSAFMDEKWSQWVGSLSAGGPVNFARMSAVTLFSKLAVEPLEKRGYRSADFIAVNYSAIEAALRRRFGELPPVRKIAYCSEADLGGRPAEPAPVASGEPLILCVSRHDARKGVDVLLRALGLLRECGIAFRARLVGGGHLLGSHRALAAKLGIGDAVEITGFVPCVDQHYREAGVFVLPSRAEQSGALSLVEALRHGLASVASACDGIPEDIEDGRTGLLVPPGDARALALALERMLGDQGLRARLGEAGRTLHQRRFTPEALAADLGALYSDAVELALARVQG